MTTPTNNNQHSTLLFQSSGAEIHGMFRDQVDTQTDHIPAKRDQSIQTASPSILVASRDEVFTFDPDHSGPRFIEQIQDNPWSTELRPLTGNENGSLQQPQLDSDLCLSYSFTEPTGARPVSPRWYTRSTPKPKAPIGWLQLKLLLQHVRWRPLWTETTSQSDQHP
jgi:hypothetical protein